MGSSKRLVRCPECGGLETVRSEAEGDFRRFRCLRPECGRVEWTVLANRLRLDDDGRWVKRCKRRPKRVRFTIPY